MWCSYCVCGCECPSAGPDGRQGSPSWRSDSDGRAKRRRPAVPAGHHFPLGSGRVRWAPSRRRWTCLINSPPPAQPAPDRTCYWWGCVRRQPISGRAPADGLTSPRRTAQARAADSDRRCRRDSDRRRIVTPQGVCVCPRHRRGAAAFGSRRRSGSVIYGAREISDSVRRLEIVTPLCTTAPRETEVGAERLMPGLAAGPSALDRGQVRRPVIYSGAGGVRQGRRRGRGRAARA